MSILYHPKLVSGSYNPGSSHILLKLSKGVKVIGNGFEPNSDITELIVLLLQF